MPEGGSLVNLGGLAEPATALINRVSEAIGGLYRPYQIRRVAQAEADAALISAQGDIAVSELQRRAFQRFIASETRRQQNIEAITDQALPQLEPGAQPGKMEDDWIVNFFDGCKAVGDEQMQALWARILAGEANAPGTFAKRTVNLMVDMDQRDTQAFGALRNFCLGLVDGDLAPFIYSHSDPVHQLGGVTYSSLAHLQDLGLVRFIPDGGGTFGLLVEGTATLSSYWGEIQIRGVGNGDLTRLEVGEVLLTESGEELARVCTPSEPAGFRELLIARWRTFGWTVSPLEPAPTPEAPDAADTVAED